MIFGNHELHGHTLRLLHVFGLRGKIPLSPRAAHSITDYHVHRVMHIIIKCCLVRFSTPIQQAFKLEKKV
jgi:hypothetical protein